MNHSQITDELLEKASEMSEAERKAFLQTFPKEVSDQVNVLLAADEAVQQNSLLNPVTGGSTNELDAIEEIGPYKIVSILGKGGMGTVFEAQQDKPIKRRVALKLINIGMDSEAVISRFEAERQALALMNHPNIAQVFDGGTSEKGRPYFVMELVDGVPLDQYCDEKRLTTQQRLDLFLLICDAVQHAHQQGVIHRDLKPSNILVAESEGKPVPKIIDFGLAKALHADLTDRTIQTQLNQAMGTLQYMCPEQTELGSQQIDTRADIYSLGIVLYELLTGSPPLDSVTIKSMALDKVFSLIREKDFVRPSRRIQNSKLSHSISEFRSTQSSRLINELTGDLDWIVMKAIEKDRDRRYGSASEFGADVGRYLSNSVVLARPPSLRYSAGKFIKRNRGLVFAASMIASLLVVASVVSTTLFFNAEAAKKEAITERQAAIAAKTEAETETIAKQAAIDKLDNAATVGMSRLGDFAMQTGDSAEAAIWFAAAAKNSLKQPHQLDANLIRLADAADQVTIPDAAIMVGVNAKELDPDPTNQYLIVKEHNKAVEVWDIENEKRILSGKDACWIQNGLVVVRENKLGVLEFPSLNVIASVDVPKVLDISVSDDSKWISVCTGSEIKIYHLEENVFTLKHEVDSRATGSDFHPDATHLITWSMEKTCLLQLPKGDSPTVTRWSRPTIVEDLISSGSVSGIVKHALNHALRPRFIGNSTDVLMISADGTDLEIRDENDQLVPMSQSLRREDVLLYGFALNEHGTKLAKSFGFNVAMYSLNVAPEQEDDARRADVKLLGDIRQKNDNPALAFGLSFNRDGSLLIGSEDGFASVMSHHASDGVAIEFIRHQFNVSPVASSDRSEVFFTAQRDRLVRRWVRGNASKHSQPPATVAWKNGYLSAKSPDGEYFVPVRPGIYGAIRSVQVFNRDGTPACEPLDVGDWYQFGDFDPSTNQLWIAVSEGSHVAYAPHKTETLHLRPGHIKLLDWKSGEVTELVRFDKGILSVKKFGNYLVANISEELIWFNLETESIEYRFPTGRDWIAPGNHFFEVSPTGKMIACFGTDGGVRIFDQKGKLLHHLGKDGNWISGVFSRDEKVFAAGQVGHARNPCANIWELENGKPIQAIPHPSNVLSTCFSPDEKYLLTGCGDGQARVFDSSSGKLIGVATHETGVYTAKFYSGEDLIITGCRDGTCRIWEWRTGIQITSQPVGEIHEAVAQLEIDNDFIRLFGWSGKFLTCPHPRTENAKLIDFYQWCTGRQWNSVDQSPSVLTTQQWMELWHQRPKEYVRGRALRRLGEANAVAFSSCINAGGPALEPSWAADSSDAVSLLHNSTSIGTSTNVIDTSDPSVPEETPVELFQSGRSADEMAWDIPTRPGNYEISLYFCETEFNNVHARVFNVSIEGHQVLDNYDIVADVGANKGVVKKFLVTVDANLDIDFGQVKELPIVAAIRIAPARHLSD